MRGTTIDGLLQTMAELKKILWRLRQFQPGSVDRKSADRLVQLSKDIEQMQIAADKLICRMSQADRLYFKEKMPTAFALLGWAGRIDDDGKIVYDA